jgi:glutamate/tyrosine decarboxylase-like PLP-dependent enzyme
MSPAPPPDAESGDRPDFEWPAERIRHVGYQVIDWIASHLTLLPDEPVFRPVPAELSARLRAAPVPDAGETPDEVLEAFASEIGPFPFGNGHPRFFAWVNSPPAVMGVFAAALAAAMNPSVAGGNHGAVHVEEEVVGWFRSLLGLPTATKGLLTSGGSIAALVSLAAARHRAYARLGRDVRATGLQPLPDGARLVVYRSAEAHGCHQKAVELLGLGRDALRTVASDRALRLRPDALADAIDRDLLAGNVPMAVLASAGTVNTGAIDPLADIAAVSHERGVWLHVDAAYGGASVLLDEFRAEVAPISHADSIALDPHKWLYIPVDAGLVLVRDAALLRDAFSLVPPYLRTDGDQHGVQGPPWLSEYGVEQTRPFRALKIWMAMRYFGRRGYQQLVAHDIALARYLAERLRADPSFELWEPQGLSIVCFRGVPSGLSGEGDRSDALNRAALTQLQLGGEAFLSSTVLDERFWMRACVVNPRATERDIDILIEAVKRALADAQAAAERRQYS